MKKLQITEAVTAYEFMELTPYTTYVYTITRGRTVYIIDTFCGSAYMEQIRMDYPNSNFTVINTHYHFDHIWGNYSFQDSPIYAHRLCRDMILTHGIEELQEQRQFFKGKQELVLPNHCFDGMQYVLSNSLVLLYTPGHTIDGISIYDRKQKLLFVGDNLEKPLVQADPDLLMEYENTLKLYLRLPVSRFYAGHTLCLHKEDVRDTLHTIQAMHADKHIPYQGIEEQKI